MQLSVIVFLVLEIMYFIGQLPAGNCVKIAIIFMNLAVNSIRKPQAIGNQFKLINNGKWEMNDNKIK